MALTKAEIENLKLENEKLRIQVEELKNQEPVMDNALSYSIANEMKKIRQKGKSQAGVIEVKENIDHKNISLWRKDGKRIGPLHPENAIQTLQRFADLGIVLSSDRPTAEQIAKYKESKEYKLLEQIEARRRAEKYSSRKSGTMEKLCAEIAKMSGTTVDAINHLLKPSEVGKNK